MSRIKSFLALSLVLGLALTQAACNSKLCQALGSAWPVAQQAIKYLDVAAPFLPAPVQAGYAAARTAAVAGAEEALAACASGNVDEAKLQAAIKATLDLLAFLKDHGGEAQRALAAQRAVAPAPPAAADVEHAIAALEKVRGK